MGFKDIFRERKAQRRQMEQEEGFGDIKRFGVEILADEKLLARLEAYEELHDIIENMSTTMDLDDIEEQTKQINTLLHQVAIPWGRGGSSRRYAKAMRGWSGLYTMMIDIIGSSRNLIESQYDRVILSRSNLTQRGVDGLYERPSAGDLSALTETRGIVNKTWNFYNKVYTKCALFIAEMSWFDEDVRASWSGVIMPMPQLPGRAQTTLSPGMSRSLDAEQRG